MKDIVISSDIIISTHSLTRRLTNFCHFYTYFLTFQLTASQGGWHGMEMVFRWYRNFNSQPHKEADKLESLHIRFRMYFNSQPHKEADNTKPNAYEYARHFNSQPHKEADSIWKIPSVWPFLFQLTASQGGWPNYTCIIMRDRNFNSQPHKEADSMVESLKDFKLYFNSQPHKEADILTFVIYSLMTYFNSQPHKEADIYSISYLSKL